MIKQRIKVGLFILYPLFCLGQSGEDTIGAGFEQSEPEDAKYYFAPEEVSEHVLKLKPEPNSVVIGGYISSIFHEGIDSARIRFQLDGVLLDSLYSDQGLFRLSLKGAGKGKLLDIHISHPDFHPFDTVIILSDFEPKIISSELTPHYKILLRGRVYGGNMPLEGVNVEIKHAENTYNIKSRGCYYDNEEYWNCLFDGMFKYELITDDPSDSVYLHFEKTGMKPLSVSMTFREYAGDILQVKMNYTSMLPFVPLNNINLKLAFPFMTSDNVWFVGLSYYRSIEKLNKRIAIGLDANLHVSTLTAKLATFPDLEESSYDSSYISGFIGPSALFYIITPERRYFSTYIGCTFAAKLNNPEFVWQPFIGTRIFLDMNKAINLELRYYEFNNRVTEYKFNYYGNARTFSESRHFNSLQVNVGIQISF